MASASGDQVRVVSSSASTNNEEWTELEYTQRMGRMDETPVIRMPPRIKLHEEHYPSFTGHKVLMMRQFLKDNNANLGQLLTTLGTDEHQSIDMFIARAYNATISDQQRKIMSKHQNIPFTFCYIKGECGPTCKFRVRIDGDAGLGVVTGCVSHDVVKTWLNEDPNSGYPTCVPSRPPHTHYDEKFLVLDVQYKILHCLLTHENPYKQAIKSKREMWKDLEDCFMEVFGRFDKDDLHRLKTEDDGIWCEMFDLVCHLANEEHILPRLSEARQAIAEAS
ncbi:hypothetical protein NEUTE1DRAFT_67439 [Neurospora tetrasperma FGSC 2508]|uniref:Uncharacterized protein n=1 Tax=Neurospora tetrasperma (strain FGSC 2508 / ATCC MYA-4615 / P0657) TaxID=510951 RepID=F8MUE2_NEUT8|nr:uncharacterized protein NEUTE1DRAFT_67439 [Neurospora tetrasperma FGSC 2508]EGO55624.1 hypothetical protein NEUTE1DRAFT_67439 [Neurospora tetrasperma FGSC 2508]EGZ69132.1 hypothetical protein NEUTE2DRAFT_115329 [Neurospora tetrasperma FGSC 2509]